MAFLHSQVFIAAGGNRELLLTATSDDEEVTLRTDHPVYLGASDVEKDGVLLNKDEYFQTTVAAGDEIYAWNAGKNNARVGVLTRNSAT